MRFQQVQGRGDAAKAFVLVKNTSGSTFAANDPVYYETDAETDGHAVSHCAPDPVTPAGFGGLLFAGIIDKEIEDDEFGEVQAYGARTGTPILTSDSTISYGPGTQLVASPGNNYLTPFSATTSVQASPENFVTLFETLASAAANSNTTTNVSVFIRAL